MRLLKIYSSKLLRIKQLSELIQIKTLSHGILLFSLWIHSLWHYVIRYSIILILQFKCWLLVPHIFKRKLLKIWYSYFNYTLFAKMKEQLLFNPKNKLINMKLITSNNVLSNKYISKNSIYLVYLQLWSKTKNVLFRNVLWNAFTGL